MTTERSDSRIAKRSGPSPWQIGGLVLGLVVLAVIVHNARDGAVSPRIRTPHDDGTRHALSDPLFGYQYWIQTVEVFSYLALISIVVVVVVLWRRHPRHPYLLMTIAVSTLAWLDAPMNWVTFAAYNPDLWHWPEDWPLVSLSPTVEPLFIAAISMFVVPPFFPAIWALHRLRAHRTPEAFSWRHPLISLAALVFVCGFVYDFAMEEVCVRLGLYTFTQVIPFGSVFLGTRWQFPLLWQSSLIGILMIPAAVLIYRDDSGQTVAEKLAQRVRILPSRPALGSFAVMLVAVNLAFMTYGLAYTAITRWSGAATSIVCPWPWPSAKVYDPQGFYERSGAKGPFSAGIWSRWESGQPRGRPNALDPTAAAAVPSVGACPR